MDACINIKFNEHIDPHICMTTVMDEFEKGYAQMYKDLKKATILVEELTDTLNNEDVCFADCINAIISTANELDKCVE